MLNIRQDSKIYISLSYLYVSYLISSVYSSLVYFIQFNRYLTYIHFIHNICMTYSWFSIQHNMLYKFKIILCYKMKMHLIKSLKWKFSAGRFFFRSTIVGFYLIYKTRPIKFYFSNKILKCKFNGFYSWLPCYMV